MVVERNQAARPRGPGDDFMAFANHVARDHLDICRMIVDDEHLTATRCQGSVTLAITLGPTCGLWSWVVVLPPSAPGVSGAGLLLKSFMQR